MPPEYQSYAVFDTVVTGDLDKRAFIAPKGLVSQRRSNSPGHITDMVGYDTYHVLHDGEILPAIYDMDEIRREPNAYWTVTYNQQGTLRFKEFPTRVEAQVYRSRHPSYTNVTIEGPVFSDKRLEEGLAPVKSFFDNVLEDL